jgi:hypothetical protein
MLVSSSTDTFVYICCLYPTDGVSRTRARDRNRMEEHGARRSSRSHRSQSNRFRHLLVRGDLLLLL